MTKSATWRQVGCDLMEAFGIDVDHVVRLRIDVSPDKPPEVTITKVINDGYNLKNLRYRIVRIGSGGRS